MYCCIPLLSTQIFLPILGAIILFILSRLSWLRSDLIFKSAALTLSLISIGLASIMTYIFVPNELGLQFIEKKEWIKLYDLYYSLGIDSLSLYFILLTTFLTSICILYSWNSVKERVKEFMSLILILEGLIIGVFTANSAILFYIFFEAVLIPMFLIIGIWGGKERIYASFKFFIYTLFGSVPFLLGILYMFLISETAEISDMKELTHLYQLEAQQWLWLAFFLAFAIKVPMWPLHTWLPDAHVQAPTAGSVMLAGILLKLGGYGFLRFSLPLLPAASLYFADTVIILSIIAVIYTSFVALMQDDMKKMIAYSSVAHMGYVTAGIFTFSVQGIEGAIFTMLSHGLISAALFLCIGSLYDREHTKEIAFYSGLTKRMPAFALFFMIFMFGSIGLPTTSGFIGEFFVLFAAFNFHYLYGILMATGMVLGAAYMLWLYARIMFGPLNKNCKNILDITLREKCALLPIAILVILLGIAPNLILNNISKFSRVLSDRMEPLNFIQDDNDNNFSLEE